MHPLNTLLSVLGVAPVTPNPSITSLALDSRKVVNGALFLAIAGAVTDGRRYVAQAIANGAVAVLAEAVNGLITSTDHPVPVITVPQLRARLSTLARHVYGDPDNTVKIMGVTGTNGKTSCCWFIAQLLERLGSPCALMGTLGQGRLTALTPTPTTTLDVLSVYQYLAALAAQNVGALAMEVSSHGLVQGRVDGVPFTVGVFTHISRDHLDYHGTLAEYAAAKARLFAQGKPRYAVLGLDDDYSALMQAACPTSTTVLTWSLLNTAADVYASGIRLAPQGITAMVHTPWGQGRVHTPLRGTFTLANLLAVIATLGVQGYNITDLLSLIPTIPPVPGRLQALGGAGQPSVIIDYAHTPDALCQVLTALRAHGIAGRLICVFGCGGERDRGKRPLMAQAAVAVADSVIVTSDNPRTEPPEQIIAEILAGVPATASVQALVDRAEAIATAIAMASKDDVVVLAGKGHEPYQDTAGVKQPCTDRDHANRALAAWSG